MPRLRAKGPTLKLAFLLNTQTEKETQAWLAQRAGWLKLSSMPASRALCIF